MALNTGLGFSRLASTEVEIQAMLATLKKETPPKHQPYVSKKKEAKRLRLEQEQALAELRSTPLDQIEFAFSSDAKPTEAAAEDAALSDLEAEMRAALGISLGSPPPAPAAVAPAPKRKAKSKAPVIEPPAPLPEKSRGEVHFVKRKVEVVLKVLRTNGTEVPFYHMDDKVSLLECELNAGKKARKYGLRVLGTISVTVTDQQFDRSA